MIKRITLLVAIALNSLWPAANASLKENKDSLLMDFDKYVEFLTGTHPDPYSAFGGRAFFFKAVSEMRSSLQSNPSLNENVLTDSLTRLSATLCDGHTIINAGNGTDEDIFAVGHIDQSQDSLFIQSLHRDKSNLLGARINKIAGVDVDLALKEAVKKSSSENRYGPLRDCGVGFSPVSQWRRLFPGVKDSVNLEVITADGDTVDYYMPSRPSSELSTFKYARLRSNPNLPNGLFNYRTIDSDRKVMMISVPTIAARENFEYSYRNGLDFVNWMRSLYGYLGKQMPTDTLQALEGFPAYMDVFKGMLSQMKKDSVPYLVIDLRGNSGGWTPIVLPTLMMLYGDKYVMSTADPNEMYITRISPLFLEKNNVSLEQFNQAHGTHLKINDFLFDNSNAISKDSIERYRNEMIDSFMLPEKEKTFLKSLKGEPLYEPERVFVVTDAGTFSAAFHYAFYLWRSGAEIVGVTSSQAPNTFMETTWFTLPYSGISGSISNSQQVLMNPLDPRSKALTPDLPIDYSIYRKYSFNTDTPILYLLDKLKESPEINSPGIPF